MSDEHVDDLDNWGRHPRSLEVLVSAEIEILERFSQHTGVSDIDGDEL